jgi:hypothetical protein
VFAAVGHRSLCGACEPVGQHGVEGCHGNRGLLPFEHERQTSFFPALPAA